ncbi:MAG TPA: hypothetical protein VMB74_18105 [Streptosporangiaceae bacterium]|nr:hypothetical protein [Streptosporangiaceae bacterium]
MTTQPYQPATDPRDVDEDDTGTGQPSEPREIPAFGPDRVAGDQGPADPATDPDVIVVAADVVAEDVSEADDDHAPAADDHAPAADDLGHQWHDIQAMFVDDPLGSVQQAAAEADTAVSALAELLRERQATFASASGNANDTERLRESLRSYRIFCRSLTEIGDQLPLNR